MTTSKEGGTYAATFSVDDSCDTFEIAALDKDITIRGIEVRCKTEDARASASIVVYRGPHTAEGELLVPMPFSYDTPPFSGRAGVGIFRGAAETDVIMQSLFSAQRGFEWQPNSGGDEIIIASSNSLSIRLTTAIRAPIEALVVFEEIGKGVK